MEFKETFIKGLFIVEPKLFNDSRGYFYELYNKNSFSKYINIDFIQENSSKSKKGVIRGFHFQLPPYDQSKLVSCIHGKILDVAIDLRKNSRSYGKYFSVELSSENKKQIFIPKGFAHGFQALSNDTIVNYKVDNFYNPKYEDGIFWNDDDLLIEWVDGIKPIISNRDLNLKNFKNFKSPF